ncbi:hypothetical protein [Pectobacterium aroidearum]|uniref:hypothetical protein n=1 Tax=Pectobacterium aroidearum TaxID=1201031 RepID=UPI002113E130|nr:hypothetical protein [Pectobacterium aroidearum]UUE46359.1 hypothetical protein L0Y28_06920 [Pectobacterium aroidearum]UUE50580.1 hypothetical protein L0Y23_06930 [Pectobacterium aroidearum]UUE54785.1 hypothetical protein L0Y30_06930 [Pectobacterium aroidearum]UUE63193.1 hypothetical protein L0Y29_06920 [Pectobacterium aroidearum]UUE67418.1 hypothetical protein L0Y22_06920 [Pectobacterium aroidearum]
MSTSSIISNIKCGMKNAAYDMYSMNIDSGAVMNIEYLLTVNIAQALVRKFGGLNSNNSIYLEYSTEKFLSACPPTIKREKPKEGYLFGVSKVRKIVDTSRSGRIDIAIMRNYNGNNVALCAIEVKGNTPSKNLVLSDLKRNLEYLIHEDDTGKSRLQLAVSCSCECFFRHKYVVTDKDEQKKLSSITKKYQNYIKEIEIPDFIKKMLMSLQ